MNVRLKHPVGLAVVFGLATTAWFSQPAQAAVPAQLIIRQLTATGPACVGGGSYYPSPDAKAKTVAFTSWCDLVPGQNSSGNSELFLMNSKGSLTQLTHGGGVMEPSLASNGKLVVFASDRDLIPGGNTDGNFEIFTIRTDGSGLTQLTHTTGGRAQFGFQGNTDPCIDPSGQHITFSSDRDLVPGGNADGNNDLFMMNTDGSGLTQLTHTTGGWGVAEGCLDQSDGKVVFASDRDLVPGHNTDLGYEIFVMNVDGSGLVQLTETITSSTQIGCTFPRWTADGQTIYFASDVDLTGGNPDGNYEAFRMNGDGSAILQISSSVGGFGSVVWGVAEDGQTVAIESDADLVPGGNTDRNGEIYLMSWGPQKHLGLHKGWEPDQQ